MRNINQVRFGLALACTLCMALGPAGATAGEFPRFSLELEAGPVWQTVNDQQIPIWIADYVLISYGTGAIMAVPAHDQRDFEFAQQYGIDIKSVVEPGPNATSSYPPKGPPKDGPGKTADDKDQVFTGAGIAINSGEFNGLTTEQFKQKITVT